MISPSDEPRQAFERCVEPILQRAAGYAMAIIGNRTDAEDAVQDAMLKGFLGYAGYDAKQSFKAWWLAIVRNCCIDVIRKRKRRAEVSYTHDLHDVPQSPKSMQLDDLRESLERLAPIHKEILILRYFGECSYSEIGESLGIPQGTVMSRLHAARRALATIYQKEQL